MKKNIPGFCTELVEACKIFDVDIEELCAQTNVRKYLKEKLVTIQSGELLKRMLVSSKMDNTLLNRYCFNGKMMAYLGKLSFDEACAIFRTRYRMWSTKKNFPGRWKDL